MNSKFEDMTSNKYSAKDEFNRLVQTLTTQNPKDPYQEGSDTGNEADVNDSQNSSFDEETMHLNHKNLKQFFQKKAHVEKRGRKDKKKQGKANNAHEASKKKNYPERNQFSNSRYEQVEDDEEMPQLYSDPSKNSGSEDVSDYLYQEAKNSMNRTKMLLMQSQQDSHFIEQMSYSENGDSDVLNMSRKRVENILRNKQQRKHTYELNEEDSDKVKISTDFEHGQPVRGKQSRNNVHSRMAVTRDPTDKFIHQTTSSGNMVLYDSVARASSQSPQDMLDPQFLEKMSSQRAKAYQGTESDSDDILQNEKVADETHAFYYAQHSDGEEGMADLEEDYDEYDTSEMHAYRGRVDKYAQQLSGSKFKH